MSAITLMGINNAAKAELLLRESLALREKTLAENHWILDTSRSILGECLAENGNFIEAESMLFDSYKNLRNKLGENHEQTQNARKRIEHFEKKLQTKKCNLIKSNYILL